ADREALFAAPKHPYTQALMHANPVPGSGRRKNRVILKGDVPSPVAPPPGCRFHPRCPFAVERCKTEIPALRNVAGPGERPYQVACHLVESKSKYPSVQ